MTAVSFFSSGGTGAPALGADLEAAGLRTMGVLERGTLVQDVIRAAPDVVVCYEDRPDDALFAVTAELRDKAPRAFVLFTTDPDPEKIERGVAAGVHAYVVDGYAPARLRSIIGVAQARFRLDRSLREELSEVRNRLPGNGSADRVEGALVPDPGPPDQDASKALRPAAMRPERRTGQTTQQGIDAARYADAMNRAGQLRMLSQRIVKLHALRCIRTGPDEALELSARSVVQVEANLAVLGRTLSRATFGDLLDGVLVHWAALKGAVVAAPEASRMPEVDAAAERLLVRAEALTRALEMAGLAAALHVINVSGRQRMLSQRIAKAAILSMLPGAGPTSEAEARRAEEDFEQGLAFLRATPLSTGEIQAAMAAALEAWTEFKWVVAAPTAASAEVAALSEVLLARFNELTSLYEQRIQISPP